MSAIGEPRLAVIGEPRLAVIGELCLAAIGWSRSSATSDPGLVAIRDP